MRHTIEFRFWAGCPSHPEALELPAERARRARGGRRGRVEREVFTHEEADELALPRLADDPRRRPRRRPRGRRGADRRSTCRIYRLPDGRAVAGPEPRATGGSAEMSLALEARPPVVHACPASTAPQHSLDDYAASDVLVLVQSCNHCPYVLAWEGRHEGDPARLRRPRGADRRRSTRTTRAGTPRTRSSEMRERARSARSSTSTTCTTRTSRSRAPSARERTPEVFLFDRDRRLVYHGAIDDNRDETARDRALPPRRARRGARAAASPQVAETPPVGLHRQVARLEPQA